MVFRKVMLVGFYFVQPNLPLKIFTHPGNVKKQDLTLRGFLFRSSFAHNELGGLKMRQVVIYPGEDGYWVAECPSLPGCLSQGKTREEAISNIREAINGYVAALEQDNIVVPEDHFDALLVAV